MTIDEIREITKELNIKNFDRHFIPKEQIEELNKKQKRNKKTK